MVSLIQQMVSQRHTAVRELTVEQTGNKVMIGLIAQAREVRHHDGGLFRPRADHKPLKKARVVR